mgnify:CR=1 FL=1|tara:strand:- start:1994 stop:2770 length:777 start_codon:yes stop_codon:yes gene_type:complete
MIDISHWYGRLGNNIQQCAVGLMAAEILQSTFSQSLEHGTIERHETTFGQGSASFRSKWFYWEGPYKETNIPVDHIYSNMRRICKTYIAPHLKVERVDVPDNTIVIHIRSGDIFDQVHPNGHQYTPNPLDFYNKLLAEFDHAIVVTEPDANNPIVEILRENPKVTVQSKSVNEDFATIMSAKNVANSGVGTFAMAAALCSDKIENFWCTDLHITEHLNFNMLIGTDVNVKLLRLSNYLIPGQWKNDDSQREFIMEYIL